MRIRWRGLELPNRVVSDRNSLTDTYGKFTAEPFERGFGVTVGNSPAPHPPLQPGRKCGHSGQDPGRPA